MVAPAIDEIENHLKAICDKDIAVAAAAAAEVATAAAAATIIDDSDIA